MIGPFIFFDHFGSVTFDAGQGFDVRPHPHIGIAIAKQAWSNGVFDTIPGDNDFIPIL